MGPVATEQQREVIAAVLDNPALACVFAKMLKEVGNDPTALAHYRKSGLANALDTLPEVPSSLATPQGVAVTLEDSRENFEPHKAYLFSVEASKGTVRQELEVLLGKEATDQLAKDWGNRCDLDKPLQATQVALFLDSNDKARNRNHAARSATTTQDEDFEATGYDFSSDLAATLLCARIKNKAESGTGLSDAEQDLLSKLKLGAVRSCSGTLDLCDDGSLRASSFFLNLRDSDVWAFGSPRSPALE